MGRLRLWGYRYVEQSRLVLGVCDAAHFSGRLGESTHAAVPGWQEPPVGTLASRIGANHIDKQPPRPRSSSH